MPEQPQLCVNCKKRPTLPRAEHCYICRRNAAAAMFRRWKKETIRRDK